MNRTRYDQLFHRRLDGRLSEEEEREFFRLLLDHAELRDDFDRWLAIQDEFRSAREAQPPPDLAGRIAGGILASRPPVRLPRRGRILRAPSMRIAASLLLAVVVVFGVHLLTEGPAYADRTARDREEAQILQAWAPYSLTEVQKAKILDLKRAAALRAKDAPSADVRALEEDLVAAILRTLSPGQISRYCQDHGISDGDLRSLLQRTEGR